MSSRADRIKDTFVLLMASLKHRRDALELEDVRITKAEETAAKIATAVVAALGFVPSRVEFESLADCWTIFVSPQDADLLVDRGMLSPTGWSRSKYQIAGCPENVYAAAFAGLQSHLAQQAKAGKA